MRSNPVRSALLAGSALLLLTASAAGEADLAGARALISGTVDEVLVILNDPALDSVGRRTRLEQLAQKRFDFQTMSRLVVAQYWRRFSPEEREALVEEFRSFLARTYGDRIDRYNDEGVVITDVVPAGSRGDVTVMTKITGGNYDGAEVEYRLRKRDGVWRVIDVKVEGISLVLNYRDQFKAVLSRSGPKGLLQALREKNADATVAES